MPEHVMFKMKIAFVTIHFTKNVGIGGPVYEVACWLAQNKNVEVHIFTSTVPDSENNRFIYHTVPVINKTGPLKSISFSITSAVMLYINKLIGRKFDVIHSLNRTLYKTDVVSCCGCDRAGLEIAEELAKKDIHLYSRKFIRKYRLVLPVLEYNFKSGYYSSMIATSSKIKRELINYYSIPPEKINVIPRGVDSERFKPPDSALHKNKTREKHAISEKQFVFLFVGTPFISKGLLQLIKAFSLIEDDSAVLLCIGNDPKGYKIASQWIGNNTVAGSRILFVKPVRKIEHYYGAADALIHPSYYDAFGLVIIEAMASGLPVIASKECGAVDIIKNGENSIILKDVTDEKELSKEMSLLMKNPDYRKCLGENARKTAINYSWDKICPRISDVYEEISQSEQ